MRITLASIRRAVEWPKRLSSIHDAWLLAFAEFVRRHPEHDYGYYKTSLDGDRPSRSPYFLGIADVVVILSSNEFLYHGKSDAINPLAVKGSNEVVQRDVIPRLRGKRIVILSMDALDTTSLLADALAGAKPDGYRMIHEAEFPTTIQSLRHPALCDLRPRGAAKAIDFAYWGTTKRKKPSGEYGGDRFAALREIFRSRSISSHLVGSNFGAAKAARKWAHDFTEIVPELSRARATCCFQWAGVTHLTARYHEAIAMELVPFVWQDYDADGELVEDWQRVATVAELAERIESLRDSKCFRSRLDAATRGYYHRAPSASEQLDLFETKFAEAIS